MSTTQILLGSIVLLLLLSTGFVFFVRRKRRAVHRNTILEADFSRYHEEDLPEDRLGRILMRGAPVLRDVVEALRTASEDKNVKMLFARLGSSGMKMAKVQEIRDAVGRFRKSGKKAVAFAESLGEFGPGSTAYYLATAFDRIYVQPSGSIGLTGMGMKTPFLRELLERLGVEPQLGFRKEYKSAAYTLTQSDYTGPHREADQAVLDSLLAQIMEGIVEARGIGPEKLRSLFEIGPFTSKRALEEGLVDGVAYRDEVREEAKKEAGKGARFLGLSDYHRKKRRGGRRKKKIALIFGVGSIGQGKSRYTPFGRFVMGSDTVSAALRSATKDKQVKAIVFRIDSPGGSYVASDTIWRETICAKKEGKPVIASMSDVAGSGGYFVAMACDRIIAHPGTITGSIGVVSGKMVTSELWNKVGIHWGALYTNKNADFWSDTSGYSAEQWKLVDSMLDAIYEDFVTKAAEGRKMDMERMHHVAKGRIWTGRDALERGLVDELGGFHEAIRAAKSAAKIPEDEPVQLKVFPARRSLWKRLRRGGSSGIEHSAAVLLSDLRGLVESELGLRDQPLRVRSQMID